jgi:retron-type reverse transcriptase
MTRPVSWILDADVRTSFDSVDHEWLLRIVSCRIADRRILRLIRRRPETFAFSGELLDPSPNRERN